MKKKFKAFVSLFAIVAMLTLLPNVSALTAKAANGTYSVKWVGGAYNSWQYQPISPFDDGKGHGPLYELIDLLQDGDTVAIFGSGDPQNKILDLGTKKLANLTIAQNAKVAVSTGDVKDCYILEGAYAAVNSKVENAYIYGKTTATFNGDVLNLTINIGPDDKNADVSATSKIWHYIPFRTAYNSAAYEMYDIENGAFLVRNGYAQLPAAKFSEQPTEAYKAAVASFTGTSTDNANTNTGNGNYDKVPKTGESNTVVWLMCAAVVLLAGSYLIGKKAFSK